MGYHGCEKEVAEGIVAGGLDFKISANQNDWLGDGVYFWEANPSKALDWANKVGCTEPAVVGAVIDLRNCLDLLNSSDQEEVETAHQDLEKIYNQYKLSGSIDRMPENSKNGSHALDCMVINFLHRSNELKNIPQYDTVRGMFLEVKPKLLYPTSAFFKDSHIQIAVRDTKASIKGVFYPPELKRKRNPKKK